MFVNLAIGSGLVVATTFVHAGAMVAAVRGLKIARGGRWDQSSSRARAVVVAAFVLIMFMASLVESLLWAVTFLAVGAISGFEESLYFSMVTYTTLGYGDVVLPAGWRLLASFEAANGIIMFGWTTALIVAVVQRVYFAHTLGPEVQ